MKLIEAKEGIYQGEVRDYNIKTSDRTGLTYINLNITIEVLEYEIDVQKSYCLDMGKNLPIMKIMEEVDGLDRYGDADFDKLLNYRFMVAVSYDKYGQLVADEIEVMMEDEYEEGEDE